MAQHSGGIRRPRKSYLISLLPISHFHSPFSFIHTSILSFPFFSFFGPLTFMLFPFLRIFSFLLRFAFFFSLLFLSSFSDSTHSYTLRLSSFYPRFCSRIRNTFSLLSSHSHTDPRSVRAAKHALSCSLFFASFQHFFFFALPPLVFVCSSERTALHIYRHSSRGRVFTSLSRQRIFLPSPISLSFPSSPFPFSLSFCSFCFI